MTPNPGFHDPSAKSKSLATKRKSLATTMRNWKVYLLITSLVVISIYYLFALNGTPSEYVLQNVERRILIHLEEKEGVWPTKQSDIYYESNPPQGVFIDYSISSEDILADKSILKEVVLYSKNGRVHKMSNMGIDAMYYTIKEHFPDIERGE